MRTPLLVALIILCRIDVRGRPFQGDGDGRLHQDGADPGARRLLLDIQAPTEHSIHGNNIHGNIHGNNSDTSRARELTSDGRLSDAPELLGSRQIQMA